MIDIQGILKIQGRNEEIFRKHVEDAIRHGLVESEEEAINQLAEIAKGKDGININNQVGFDDEFGVEMLLDSWRDEIVRSMSNPQYRIIFKVLQKEDGTKDIPGPNNTNKQIPITRVIALIKIQVDENSFYKWNDFGTDVIVGQIKAEGSANKRKLQNVSRDKTYTLLACAKRPDTLFPYFNVEDNCLENAKEVSHTMPSFPEIATMVYGEPIPICEMSNHVTADFELKLVKGRVSGIENPKNGKTHVNFNLGDSSVGIEDINKDKFLAYLRVGTNVNTVAEQEFGNGSYVYILSKIQKNTPREGYEDRGGLGVTAWYPTLIYPVMRQNQDMFSVQTKGVDAGDTANKIASMGSNIPKPVYPSSSNVATSQPTTPTMATSQPTTPTLATSQPTTPETPAPKSKKGKKSSSFPEPKKLNVLTEDVISARFEECGDFGRQEPDDHGCIDCKNSSPDIYNDCTIYTEQQNQG
jgi:hypothetical protein